MARARLGRREGGLRCSHAPCALGGPGPTRHPAHHCAGRPVTDAPAAVLAAARRAGCAGVYFNREYEVNELARDAAAAAAREAAGLFIQSFTDQVLAEPGAVRTGGGRFYSVFTPFRRATARVLEEAGGVKAHGRPRRQEHITTVPSTPVSAELDGFRPHFPGASTLWPAGEKEAAARLRAFVANRLASYQHDRDSPAVNATSSLSPYLAIGAISPRQCVAAAIEAGGTLAPAASGASSWIGELMWREFYKHVVVGFPHVVRGRAFRRETDAIRWNDDPARFKAWCEGRTGVPLVDAGMRQLLAEGWMHNRVRMVTAMHLAKDLFLGWRLGEAHFARHLIDHDFASSNGGWQWSASTGTDAAPYFRVFNPVAQSRRFDPEGDYIRRYVPELAALEGGPKGPIHDPWAAPARLPAGFDYPRPIADRAAAKRRVIAAFRALST